MDGILPSQNIELLKLLLGKKVTSVRRQLFEGDMDLEECEQNADGPVELCFSDNTAIHFIAKTEALSVGVVAGHMPRYGVSYVETNVTDNAFWRDRVNQEIVRIAILKPLGWGKEYPCEFGVEILFSNDRKVLIEYLDEENCPDMIKVADRYAGQPCTIQIIT